MLHMHTHTLLQQRRLQQGKDMHMRIYMHMLCMHTNTLAVCMHILWKSPRMHMHTSNLGVPCACAPCARAFGCACTCTCLRADSPRALCMYMHTYICTYTCACASVRSHHERGQLSPMLGVRGAHGTAARRTYEPQRRAPHHLELCSIQIKQIHKHIMYIHILHTILSCACTCAVFLYRTPHHLELRMHMCGMCMS